VSNREKSPHILNASSNLLGICFILLASLKVMKIAEKTFIDEVTTLAIILFMGSCILSFISIRTNNQRSQFYENIADIVFMIGLSLLFITTILYSFNVIK
jgi:ABC-type transport system involved in cytochrome c biogenesis permease subunit